MDSVYVDLSLNMATVARPSLRELFSKCSIPCFALHCRAKASNPRRTSFIFAELVGRFRNCKLSSNYAGRASKIDDNVPRIGTMFN